MVGEGVEVDVAADGESCWDNEDEMAVADDDTEENGGNAPMTGRPSGTVEDRTGDEIEPRWADGELKADED